MKYDLVSMLKEYLKKDLQEEVIKDIVNSTFPEVDGLKVVTRFPSCDYYYYKYFGEDSEIVFNRVLLTNMNNDCYIMRVKENNNDNKPSEEQIELLGDNLYLKYKVKNNNDLYEVLSIKVTDLVYTKDDDIIVYKNDKEHSISIYTNANIPTNLVKDKCVPKDLIPDYKTELITYESGFKIDDRSLFFGNTIYLNGNEDLTESMTIRNYCNRIQERYYDVYPHLNKKKTLKKDK